MSLAGPGNVLVVLQEHLEKVKAEWQQARQQWVSEKEKLVEHARSASALAEQRQYAPLRIAMTRPVLSRALAHWVEACQLVYFRISVVIIEARGLRSVRRYALAASPAPNAFARLFLCLSDKPEGEANAFDGNARPQSFSTKVREPH